MFVEFAWWAPTSSIKKASELRVSIYELIALRAVRNDLYRDVYANFNMNDWRCCARAKINEKMGRDTMAARSESLHELFMTNCGTDQRAAAMAIDRFLCEEKTESESCG